MAKESNSQSEAEGKVVIRFNLVGLIIFSIALVLAGGLLTSGLVAIHAKSTYAGTKSPLRSDLTNSIADGISSISESQEVPPWGDLLVRDIEVERPEEYAAFELTTNQPARWIFDKMLPERARSLMLSCGLSAGQVDRALSPEHSLVVSNNTIVSPDDDLIFSLTPETRAKLYHQLALSGANHYMQYPFCFPNERINDWFDDAKLSPAIVGRMKGLLYSRGGAKCFSDFEAVMRSLPSAEDRRLLVKALSRQPALLVRLRIGPETDIDRVLGYWAKGVKVKDARPLLESVKRLDNGGNISLLYLLPRFARERLYTFPLPPKANDPAMDCHWTTMNFFNDTPDDRFANPAYTVQYLTTNYYRVAKPSLYGDIVLVLNDAGSAIHSAVFLAGDIVFTKNGNNYAQPWMLMRLNDLLLNYSQETPSHIVIYRNKNS